MQIHYFQRYHSKENVDTSNTMLMLSRLYNYNADKFFSMLNSLILGDDESPEITFDLQVAGDESVPDAVISQKSFKIVVETKLYNQFDKQQLVNHLEQFGAEDIKVLLTIDPRPMKQQLFDEMTVELKKYNSENMERLIHPIKHVNLTFEQLVEAMEDIIDDRDTEIISVLDDFKKYCFDEKLIPDGHKWMRAIVAGTTFQDNMDLNLFYDQEARKFSEHGYIGLYKDKSIRAIGRLKKTIIAVEVEGKMTYRAESGEAPTPDEICRINEAIHRAEDYGYNLRTISHRYFMVEKFYPIDFRKSSKNPIQKSKFFNLADMFGYTEAYKAAIKIVGGEQYILSAVMHADERNRAMSEALGEDVYHYHLHVVYIPVVEKEIRWTKRCKDKSLVGKVKETIMQVSMSKKWASKPILDETTGEPLRTAKGKPVLRKSYSVLQDDFFEHMRSAGYDDVERGERGSSEEHLTVTQFKTEREQERLAQLQEVSALAQVEADKKNKEAASAEKKAAQARAKLDDVAPLLKGMEKLAADFSDDPERTLPEAGPLESAKSYREKKAKPLWEKIVKVLRSVYRAYFDLKSKFERLQSAYDREVSKNGSLSARIYEVCAERDGLKGQVRDYERVRRAIGPEQADRILEAAYQQEQVEKEQKWGARSKIRVGAR